MGVQSKEQEVALWNTLWHFGTLRQAIIYFSCLLLLAEGSLVGALAAIGQLAQRHSIPRIPQGSLQPLGLKHPSALKRASSL